MNPHFPYLALPLVFALLAPAHAREYIVDGANPQAADGNAGTAEAPLKSINRAAQLAAAGDTVRVRAGLYREAVRLSHSGTVSAPISFRADPPGGVIVTGADLTTGWQRVPGAAPVYRVPWSYIFEINRVNGKPIEHHPDDAPLWGRAEQVIADGRQLLPQPGLEALQKAWGEHSKAAPNGGTSPVLQSPLPNLGGPFGGCFAVDTTGKKELYVWLSDGSDPNAHRVEAATRGQIFGVNPWEKRDGVQWVEVRGFIFRYGATFPQRPAVWLHGAHNLLENCLVEAMAGGGAGVGGTMRGCIVRGCGHTGGAASGDGFLNENNLWEGNCWKPISRGWDAGGVKMAMVDGGVFRRCVFRRNGGPGLWFDIHVRNVLVTECAFLDNEGSGLFIEISRDIRAIHNLAAGNATDAVGHGSKDWGSAGIMVAESENCIVAFNTCAANKDGITLREQGPRPLETEDFGTVPYHNTGHVIVGNVCALNRGYQLGLWYDNGFFGWHPADKQKYGTEAAYEAYLKTVPDRVFDPTQQGLTIDRNLYFVAPTEKLTLYGVEWRPKHQVFSDLAAFATATGFDAHSRVADPLFVAPATGDFRFQPDSPARALQLGWLMAPANFDAWLPPGPAPTFEIAPRKAKDTVTAHLEGDRLIFDVQSADGIGDAKIKRLQGVWPASVWFRLNRPMLEGLTVSNGRTTWRNSRSVHAAPGASVEVELPRTLFDEGTSEIALSWVDAYRN